MDDVVDVSFVVDIDADLLPFAKAQERPRHRPVIGERVYRLAGCELEPQRRNAKRIVRRLAAWL